MLIELYCVLIKTKIRMLGVMNLRYDKSFKKVVIPDSLATIFGVTHRNELAISGMNGIFIQKKDGWNNLNTETNLPTK